MIATAIRSGFSTNPHLKQKTANLVRMTGTLIKPQSAQGRWRLLISDSKSYRSFICTSFRSHASYSDVASERTAKVSNHAFNSTFAATSFS